MKTRPRVVRELQHIVTDPLDTQAIGQLLRELRERIGVKQLELAATINARYQNLSRLETGRTAREPTLSTMSRYVEALGWELVLVVRPKGRARKAVARKD